MLTDYHLHLRSDDVDATTAEYFTQENVERYRAVAGERGIAELGVSEHIYRFEQALAVWRHPFWLPYAHDDIDAYCAFVREQTDLRLGIEADFVPGGEDRMAELLGARDFDYVVGAVHFVREGAVDMDDYSVWDSGRSAEEIWRRYFQTLGEAARSGLFDVLAHPDLVKMWGGERPLPEGDLRRYYELAMDGIAESNIAVEVSTAGLRKRAGSSIRPPRSFRCAWKPALRWRSRAMLTAPRTWVRTITRRSSCSSSSAWASCACLRGARGALRWSGPRHDADRHRL